MSQRVRRYCPICGARSTAEHCPIDGAATLVRPLFAKDALTYMPGDMIAGRYRIEGALGRGAYGAVYSARHTGTDQSVALKMLTLTADGSQGEEHVQRFFREARATARLRHVNTVRVFDVGQTGEGPLFLAMELLQGPALSKFLRREFSAGRTMSEAHAVDLAVPILRSLGEAHRAALVHRDVKPGNIVLHRGADDETIVKVLDFGIARAAGSHLTETGQSLGTPAFMSPEQAQGHHLDGRSDLYAVAVLMYLCATGKLPFLSDDVVALMYMHVNDPAPDPRSVGGGQLSDRFVQALLRALSKLPGDRFDDAQAMRLEFEALRRDLHPDVPPFALEADDALWTLDVTAQHDPEGGSSRQVLVSRRSETVAQDAFPDEDDPDLPAESIVAPTRVARARLADAIEPALGATPPPGTTGQNSRGWTALIIVATAVLVMGAVVAIIASQAAAPPAPGASSPPAIAAETKSDAAGRDDRSSATPPAAEQGEVAVRKAKARAAFKLSHSAAQLTARAKFAQDAVRLDPNNDLFAERLVELEALMSEANLAAEVTPTDTHTSAPTGAPPTGALKPRAAGLSKSATKKARRKGAEWEPERID